MRDFDDEIYFLLEYRNREINLSLGAFFSSAMQDTQALREDVSEGSYAIRLSDDGQELFQYESPAPWEEPEWIMKRQYDHGEMPTLDLTEVTTEQSVNGDSLQSVTIYTATINGVDGGNEVSGGNDGDSYDSSTITDDVISERGFVIRFSDGQTIPEDDHSIHTTQEENMGKAVEYLMDKYDLIDVIDIPHYPPNARKNCSINNVDNHPDGRDMRDAYELPGGYYLHVSLNKGAKIKRTDDLAQAVGLSAEYLGRWNQ